MTAPAGSEDAGLVLSAEERLRRLVDTLVCSCSAVDCPRRRSVGDLVDAARAEGVTQAAHEMQQHGVWAPDDGYLDTYEPSHVQWLHQRAARIAQAPPPAETSQPLRATNDDRENA